MASSNTKAKTTVIPGNPIKFKIVFLILGYLLKKVTEYKIEDK